MARRFGDVWGYRNPLRNSISGLEIPVNQPIDGVADITSFPQICRAVSLLFGRRSRWRCVASDATSKLASSFVGKHGDAIRILYA
jgi:hypothetical protein